MKLKSLSVLGYHAGEAKAHYQAAGGQPGLLRILLCKETGTSTYHSVPLLPLTHTRVTRCLSVRNFVGFIVLSHIPTCATRVLKAISPTS